MINLKFIVYLTISIITIVLIIISNPLEKDDQFNNENLAEVVEPDKKL